MNNKVIEDANEYIDSMFCGNFDGHDKDHSMRVYTNAMNIAKSYPECDREVVALSALLHDVDDHKLFDTKNNSNARAFLKAQGIAKDVIEQICININDVSFSKNRGKRPESLEGKIVQDADRLDAIGAVGVARAFAYGGKVGRSLDSSILHFHDKLLLLKDEMNTSVAKEIAKKRHAFLENFLEEFEIETE